MSSLLRNIPEWVASSPPEQRNFRRAVHSILEAISSNERLSRLLCMKGGILMALHYSSPRFTTDIDFSTPERFTDAVEKEVTSLLSERLIEITDQLGYDIDCRLQGWKVQPSREKTYITIQMKVGFAERGKPEHKKLISNQSPHVVSIDYSFMESIPEVEEVSLGDDGILRVYGLSTLVAEKIRSLLQQPIRNRTRRQDVFDLNFLLAERPILQDIEHKRRVLDAILAKCADRDVPVAAHSMDQEAIYTMAVKDYETLSVEIEGNDLPKFEEAFDQIREYYKSLPW